MMDGEEQRKCRLCFVSQAHLIDIYDEFESNIAAIISEHIGKVSKTDALPKYICTECWQKTEEFHEFHRSVQLAQDDYLKTTIKCEVIECDPSESVDPLNGSYHDINAQYLPELENPMQPENDRDLELELEQEPISKPDGDEISEWQFESEDYHQKFEENIEIDEEMLSNIKQDEDEDEDEDGDVGTNYIGRRPNIPDVYVSAEKRRELLEQFDTTCDICSMDLGSLQKAITHYKKCHKKDGYIKCCRLKFKKECQIDDHIKLHIRPDMFQCPIEGCRRILRTRLSLCVHVSDHRSRDFICDICGIAFIRLKRLARHILAVHAKVSCNICSKKFKSNKKLEDHLKFSHKTAEVMDQKKKLAEISKFVTQLSETEMEQLMAKHCEMLCSICNIGFKSLPDAQYHYSHAHSIGDGFIQCCSHKFKTIRKLQGHLMWHKMPDVFKCEICMRELDTIDSLRGHLRLHETPQTVDNNECPECKKKLSSKDRLTIHMRRCHGAPAASRNKNLLEGYEDRIHEFFDMRCELCDFQFTSLQHAKLHYFDEHKITDGYLKCSCGDIKFKTNNSIADHIEFHLGNDPDRYKCHLCDKVLPRKCDLSQHLTYHKTLSEKKYACFCGKAFTSKFLLTRHGNQHQKEKKTKSKIPCEQCQRTFLSQEGLKSHVTKIHSSTKDTEPKSFLCQTCGKSFKTLAAVKSHTKEVHTLSEKIPKFQCHICDRKYKNSSSLRFHIRLGHESEPQTCPHCGKLTSSPAALLRHIKIVHENEEFECHVCHKKLKSSTSFKEHVATHTSDKLYKCSFCSDTFNWRSNMYIHQKKAHPEEWKLIPAPKRRK